MEIFDLLNKWELDNLYEKFQGKCFYFTFYLIIINLIFFSDENITIETLKILKPHHIQKIFSTLRTGDEAKFEFELEKWKKSFEGPVQNNTETFHPINTNRNSQFSVLEILSNTKSGKEILKFYEKHEILQEEHRTLLINTVTKYLDLNGFDCSLSDCAALEKQICTVFPSEELVNTFCTYIFYI